MMILLQILAWFMASATGYACAVIALRQYTPAGEREALLARLRIVEERWRQRGDEAVVLKKEIARLEGDLALANKVNGLLDWQIKRVNALLTGGAFDGAKDPATVAALRAIGEALRA